MSTNTPINITPVQLAIEHLQRIGHTVLDPAPAHHPISVVSSCENTLIFTIVQQADAGGSWSAPTSTFRHRLRAAASRWLATNTRRPRLADIRLDSIGVDVDHDGRLVRLEHVEDAH